MTYKDNRDILSWKRMIENLQEKTDEGVEEYNEAQLGIEDQEQIETEHYNVVVSSNEMGIIVDVYDKHDKQREPLKSDQYWDEDVMEGKEPVTEGTWSIPETPEQVEKLTTLLKNPLDAETALDELYDVFGDDQLFDDLEVMKREEPETDVRHVVISRLKDMNFIKEVRENNKPIKEEDGVSAEDLVDIITHRIKMNKELMLSLLGDEGPEPLMNAIEDVADFYSGTTEVGSSDVSAMVDAVKKNLGHIEEKQVNELEDDGSLEYGDSEEDMAKALGMSQDEFWEFAEDIGVDQYGGLTKDNYQDVMDHIVDNEARYKQIHIFRKAGEFDESDEQLDEIIPAIAAGVGRAALALAPKAKSIWNALKGTSKTASKKADLKAKSAELYGPTRTFPGGRVGGQFKNQAAGKAKAAELYGPTRTFPGGRVGGQHHLAKGPKTNVATKTTNAKTTTKGKHTGSKDGNVNYSAGGRYTQGIPKSKYIPKPK